METKFFTLTKVCDGVFAAVVKEGQGALGNAGFIDLGDAVLVFDTFMLPEAASLLREAAEELTGNKVKYVVNSHSHGDHIYGNKLFKDASIISTRATRDSIHEIFRQFEDPSAMRAGIEEYFNKAEERIRTESNEKMRRALEMDLSDKSILASALDSLEEVLPTVLMEDKLAIQGSRRAVELYTFGGGHTVSDIFMYLPEEQILFAGDLVLVGHHPWMGSGSPDEWLSILAKLDTFQIAQIVPGHGNVGDASRIQNMKDYISGIMEFVGGMKDKGMTLEEILALPVPQKFEDLESVNVYEWNIHFLYEYVSKLQPSGQ